LELVAAKGAHTGLDAAGANADDGQSGKVQPWMQGGLAVIGGRKCQSNLANCVENGQQIDGSKRMESLRINLC
jgi:hypothetical protein